MFSELLGNKLTRVFRMLDLVLAGWIACVLHQNVS